MEIPFLFYQGLISCVTRGYKQLLGKNVQERERKLSTE
jgi:hypothetical protein